MKTTKKILSVVLALAMVLSLNGLSHSTFASAASKTLKLSATKVTVKVKASKKVTVKNAPKGAKVTWSSKDKKIATVSSKGKITGKKAGKTKVIAKVTYKKKVKKVTKKVTKKLTVQVTVQKVKTVTPTATPLKEETSNLTDEHKSANGLTTKDNGQMRTDLTSADMMRFMGLGWNYGNSLEQSIAADNTKITTVEECETSANNSALTQENVDNLAKYGFKNIRIPVAWSNLMKDDGTYTINEGYLNRVEEVMNYALNNEMYVIVNIHYDGDWWGQFGDADENIRAEAMKRYTRFWEQISERYKEYSDRLIFESANEELGDRLNDNWRTQDTNNKTGTLTVDEQYETLNKINKTFVNIVRKSGGNNASRYLLIAGYSTNIERTCDDRFIMPEDLAANGKKRLSVSVHYYSPWNYCGGGEYQQTEGMAERSFSWGTDADVEAMHKDLDKMAKFTEQGYGVIIGEFGVQTSSVDGIPKYFKELANYSMERGMSPVLWDNGSWFDRDKNVIKFDDISSAILSITGSTATFELQNQKTEKPKYQLAENEDELTLKFTWEGTWVKNSNSNNASCTLPDIDENGWKFHCNDYFYWANIATDWSQFTQPYIRVTASDADHAALEIGYATYRSSSPDDLEKASSTKRIEIAYEDNWNGQCYAIDKEMLTQHGILWLAGTTGPTITKIEIFDGPAIQID